MIKKIAYYDTYNDDTDLLNVQKQCNSYSEIR